MLFLTVLSPYRKVQVIASSCARRAQDPMVHKHKGRIFEGLWVFKNDNAALLPGFLYIYRIFSFWILCLCSSVSLPSYLSSSIYCAFVLLYFRQREDSSHGSQRMGRGQMVKSRSWLNISHSTSRLSTLVPDSNDLVHSDLQSQQYKPGTQQAIYLCLSKTASWWKIRRDGQ